ncbi:MAG: helix-turn-helix domain-containing protein, partial [Gaiellales bacterium]
GTTMTPCSWLTAAAVAEQLGVSPRTILRYIDAGELAAVRLPGGRLRIAQQEVDQRLVKWSTASSAGRMLAAAGANEEDEHADG